MPSVSALQRFGLGEVAGNDLLRHPTGDQEDGAPFRCQGDYVARQSRDRQGVEERRVHFSERNRRLDEKGYYRQIRSAFAGGALRYLLATKTAQLRRRFERTA